MAEVVSLQVNGRLFDGWKEVKITRSMKAIASGFSLSLTDRWSQESKPWFVRPGDSCLVKIDGFPVISGYVDSLNTSLSAGERTITVEGREKTADLVDCTLDQSEFVNLSLEALARQLADPYGVSVRNLSGVTRQIPTVAVSMGDTIHQVIERYAKKDGVLLTSDGLGTLQLAKLGSVSAAIGLKEGVNLLSCSASFDNRNRFSEYIVRGGNGSDSGEDAALQTAVEGRSKDKGIRRYRLMVLNAESAVSRDEAEKRAQWELTTRQASAWTVSAKVQGWKAAGRLWSPNTLVTLTAPSIGVGAKLLVTDVTFSQTISGGTTTELSLTRRDAFIPEPEKADDDDLTAGLLGEAGSAKPSRLEKKLEALYGSQ